MRLREASASARVSNCGLSPAAVAVVVDAVDVLASHEHGAAVDAEDTGAAGSTGSAATASAGVDADVAAAAAEATAGGGGDTSSVVSIELSSLSSETLRTRVIGYASTPGISLGVPMMLPAEHAVAAVAVACGGSWATVDAFSVAAEPVLATVEAAVCSRLDEPDDDTVDNCSWMSIM